jgi:hypothetical protein
MEDEEEERPMFGDLELRPDAGAFCLRVIPRGMDRCIPLQKD